MNEVQPADPEARRRALLWLAVFTPVALLAVALTSTYLASVEDMAADDPEVARRKLSAVMLATSAVGAVICVGTAAYVARICGLALHAGRFPPPGVPTVREMRVMHGAQARRMATAGITLAGVLAVAGLVLPMMVWRILVLLGHRA